MLTEEQQRFLIRYVDNKGDFYKTVDSLGLDLSHIVSWQQVSQEFNTAFASQKQYVIQHLKDESYITALLRVNEALKDGVKQHTIVQKHRIGGVDKEGNQLSDFEVVRSTKNLGVPSWAITEALKESSIVRAVHTLASEGVIPASIAKRILQSANRISEEVKASFDIADKNEFVNDTKAINLIRAAVLGEVSI